jgi:hypothetical protein
VIGVPDEQWEHRLDELAEHAVRRGRLRPAAGIRARGDQRTRNQRMLSGALGLIVVAGLGTGIALGRPDGGPAPAPPAQSATVSPSPSPAPGPTSAKPTAPPSTTAPTTRTPTATTPTTKTPEKPAVFGGTREVLILPVGDESALAVGDAGGVVLSDDFGDAALFVISPITPGGSRYWIRTGRLRAGGEASCLAVQPNGTKPAKVVTAACDASAAAQLFTFADAGTNGEGTKTYTIRNGSRRYFVLNLRGEIDPAGGGLVAQERSAPPDTTFLLVDRGPARLPTIG